MAVVTQPEAPAALLPNV